MYSELTPMGPNKIEGDVYRDLYIDIYKQTLYGYLWRYLEPNATTQDSIPHGAHRVFGGGIHPGAAKKF